MLLPSNQESFHSNDISLALPLFVSRSRSLRTFTLDPPSEFTPRLSHIVFGASKMFIVQFSNDFNLVDYVM